MPTGNPRRGRGFTYLWLLFLVAIGSALLAAAGQRWSQVAAREREHELLFRGGEIAQAIAAYRAVGGGGPRSLDDLVDDRRAPQLRRHLRRAYTDPFTGQADWEPVLADDGSWRGVRSRSMAPALMLPPDAERREPGQGARISDHVFIEVLAPPPAASGVPQDVAPQVDPDPNGSWPEPGVKRQSPQAASLTHHKQSNP
jgi:type II secretory pathway pseudopilin PulG